MKIGGTASNLRPEYGKIATSLRKKEQTFVEI